jgi:RNA polymerase sigma-70 factor, ECF subfamily
VGDVLGEAAEPGGGHAGRAPVAVASERLLDLAGRLGGGMAARAAADVPVDAGGGGVVEFAVDPGVDDATAAEVLDWVHAFGTRFEHTGFHGNPCVIAAGSLGVSGKPAPDDRARQEAFERFVLPEVEVLFRVALTLVPRPADAEDLVQDTLLRAFQAIGSFDGAHQRAWLLTILRNTQINRTRRRRPELLDGPNTHADVAVADEGRSAETVVVEATFDAAVDDALASLSPRLRRVVELVDLLGLSYAETAEALGVPVGTVMSRLHRARDRIRVRLVAAGVASRGGWR